MPKKRGSGDRRQHKEKTRQNFTLYEEGARTAWGPWLPKKARSRPEYRNLPYGIGATHKRYTRVFGTEQPVAGAKFAGSTVGRFEKPTYWYKERRAKKKPANFSQNPVLQPFLEFARERKIPSSNIGRLLFYCHVPRSRLRRLLLRIMKAQGYSSQRTITRLVKICVESYEAAAREKGVPLRKKRQPKQKAREEQLK